MASILMVLERTGRKQRPERVFRDRSNPLDSLTDYQLISRYRFPRKSILELTNLIREDILRPTNRSQAIPPHIQVLATLRFLAKGDFQSEAADLHGISKSSACRCIHAVCSSLCQRLDNIKYPSNEELRKIKEDFHRIGNFPNVVGAIDCTLIPIAGMSGDDEKTFVCRKGFHSLNIQAVVDANMRFLNINAKFPGATHDAYVLVNSSLPEIVQNLAEGGWLLGDSGYPLKTWLITPLHQPANPQEIRFNKAHCRTRVVVERAFGVLKSRFRCLHKTGGSLPYTPLKSSKIIETAFRLHNKAINDKLPLTEGANVINHFHNHVCQFVPSPNANNIRNSVISRF